MIRNKKNKINFIYPKYFYVIVLWKFHLWLRVKKKFDFSMIEPTKKNSYILGNYFFLNDILSFPSLSTCRKKCCDIFFLTIFLNWSFFYIYFLFQLYTLSWMILVSRLWKCFFFFVFFDKPSNCKRLVTNNKQYNNEEIKII